MNAAQKDLWRGDRKPGSGVHPVVAQPAARDLLLDAMRWHDAPERGRLPTEEEVLAFEHGDPPTRAAAAMACWQAAKAAFLGFDGPTVRRWLDLQAPLSVGSPWEETQHCLDLGRAYGDIADGRFEAAIARLHQCRETAVAAEAADLLLESTAMAALAAMEVGEGHQPRPQIGDISDMAMSFGSAQPRFLDQLVMARACRLGGLPSRALPILQRLAAHAPEPFQPLVAWERMLSTGEALDEIKGSEEIISLNAARALADLLRAAADGRREDFDEAVARCGRLVRGFAPASRDLHRTVLAIDPSVSIAGQKLTQTLQRFLTDAGSRHAGPVTSLCTQSATGQSTAYVLSGGAQPPRRVAGAGHGLLVTGATNLLDGPSMGRPQTLLSTLMLAGADGVQVRRVFRSVYGTDYHQASHQGVFNVLLHRARTLIRGKGTIRRRSGRLYLQLLGPSFVADPAFEQKLEGTLTQWIEEHGPAGAKRLAKALDTPLRSVQSALKRLVSAGSVLALRRGRNVVYQLAESQRVDMAVDAKL